MTSGWQLIAKPYLAVDDIAVAGPTVTLNASSQGLRVETESDRDAIEVAQLLSSIRSPESPVWTDESRLASLETLFHQLDQHGLIGESASPEDSSSEEAAELERTISELAAWLEEACLACGPDLTVQLRSWAADAVAQTRGRSDSEQNLWAWVLDHMTAYWHRSAPTVIGTALTAFTRAGIAADDQLPERYLHDPLSDTAAISAELDAPRLPKSAGDTYQSRSGGAQPLGPADRHRPRAGRRENNHVISRRPPQRLRGNDQTRFGPPRSRNLRRTIPPVLTLRGSYLPAARTAEQGLSTDPISSATTQRKSATRPWRQQPVRRLA